MFKVYMHYLSNDSKFFPNEIYWNHPFGFNTAYGSTFSYDIASYKSLSFNDDNPTSGYKPMLYKVFFND